MHFEMEIMDKGLENGRLIYLLAKIIILYQTSYPNRNEQKNKLKNKFMNMNIEYLTNNCINFRCNFHYQP